MTPSLLRQLVRVANLIICLIGIPPAVTLLRMSWGVRHDPAITAQTRALLWWLSAVAICGIGISGTLWAWLFVMQKSTLSQWPGIASGITTLALDAALYVLLGLRRRQG